MAKTKASDIVISAHDANVLGLMLGDWTRRHHLDEAAADALADTLSAARVVPTDRLPDGVVAMHAKVTYVHHPDGESHTVTLVYPEQANLAPGWVSVLSPIGRALLGRSVGSKTTVVLPSGRAVVMRIVGVERNDATDAASTNSAATNLAAPIVA